MLRLEENIFSGAVFHQLAKIHNRNIIADISNYIQVVADNGKAEGYYNEVLREIVGTGCYIPISTPAVIIVYDKDVYDGVYYRRDATKIWLNDCE